MLLLVFKFNATTEDCVNKIYKQWAFLPMFYLQLCLCIFKGLQTQAYSSICYRLFVQRKHCKNVLSNGIEFASSGLKAEALAFTPPTWPN